MNDQLGKMMKQAQKLQTQMASEQEKLAQTHFKASAGGGMAEAEVNGKLELISVKIMPEAVDPEDVEMLEDVVLAAVQEAQKQAAEARDSQMSSLTGGLNLPGMG